MKKLIVCMVLACLMVGTGCATSEKPRITPRVIPQNQEMVSARTRQQSQPRTDTAKKKNKNKNKRKPQQIKPTYANVPYGEENPEVQVMDVYLAKSDTPTPVMVNIHGGGWRAGSKDRIPDVMVNECLPNGISVVSVEYRFTYEAIHPAQVNDCTRAIQFIRHKAKEWNIDPERIGVMGGSAGGHLVTWIGLHDDAATIWTTDPVKRQSSRVSCVVNYFGPTDFNLIREIEHKHPAFRTLLGYEPGTPAEDIPDETLDHVSPITYISSDDPPVFTAHGTADPVVPVRHALDLDKKLRDAGVESELVLVEGAGHGGFGRNSQAEIKTGEFIKKHLLK